MKLLTVVGARPQFIKAAAFSYCLKKFNQIEEVIVHTGQHYDPNMSEVFFDQLGIPKPDYRLESGGKSHGEMTGYQLGAIEKILLKEKPDWVIVYGDTNSTLAGALAAAKIHIPVAHIEAGLRSHNKAMPEEVNRILTDRLSTLLFCPTQTAADHLKKEGYESFECKVEIVGDIMFDALKLFSSNLEGSSTNPFPYALCTLHRAENTDNGKRLKELCQSLNSISEKLQIVLPLHPRTKKRITDEQIVLSSNIKILEPMSYIDFISYMKHSELVISDSGGIQKEAYFLHKNCIVLREETEWSELIERKNNILTGTSNEKIIQAFKNRESLNQDFSKPIYGTGKTAKLIIEKLLKFNGN
jgi:UDP-GlcNAc3NAcA epimerase